MEGADPRIVILGASGLIGGALANLLAQESFDVVGIARRFDAAQRAGLFEAVEAPVVDLGFEDLGADDLGALLDTHRADIVVNCLGVLQDGPGGGAEDVHHAFVARLVQALGARDALLVHVSIPGDPDEDRTDFARTKRSAEAAIAASPVAHAILRPGFVLAPVAYGGSALMRALAALAVDLPRREAGQPFAATDIDDLARTVAFLAKSWRDGRRDWRVAWDVMEREAGTVGDVLAAMRQRIGGPRPLFRLPGPLMALGARAGDVAGHLGWSPPIRSTALAEMRRGVAGDPQPWIDATGIAPTPLATSLARLPFGVQEKWFARLYLLKALVLVVLSLFWIVSGLIALTVSFEAASQVLQAAGIGPGAASVLTVVTGLADVAIGIAIAWQRTSRLGLMAGILLSAGYLLGSLVLLPALWLDPLGAMVKTVPALVLMLVALAIGHKR